MQANRTISGRVRRTVNELVLAEMFLVQATVESATAIGAGFNDLGKQLSDAGDEPISNTLQRIADNALEPYTSRYRYFRDMVSSDS